MRLKSISNTQNYNKQNFGVKISSKALEQITEHMRAANSKKLFSNTPNIFETIKKYASDAIELISVSFQQSWGHLRIEPEYTYKIGNNFVMNGYRPCSELTTSIGKEMNENLTEKMQTSFKDTFNKLVSEAMIALAKEGKLKRNLEQIKADFPHNTETIKKSWSNLCGLDEVSALVFERQKAEKAKNVAEILSTRAAKRAKNAEFRKNHPILSRILGK